MTAVSQCGTNAQRVNLVLSTPFCIDILFHSSLVHTTKQPAACLPIFATPSLVMLTVKPAATLSNASKLLKGIA